MKKIVRRLTTLLLLIVIFPFCSKDSYSDPILTDEVIVSSTRLKQTQSGASVSIIESKEITDSTAQDIPHALGQLHGVHNRDLYGNTSGVRATVDLRGFGAVATQNSLVLLDGRRLTDVDLAAVDFSNIPMSSIKHIEVIRGNAGSVLYGDGAVGGVINIVTKSPAFQDDFFEQQYSFAHPGQTHNVNMSAKRSQGPYSVSIASNFIHGEGFRDNNNLIQKNLIGQLRYTDTQKEAFIKVGSDFQSIGLPGARIINRVTGINQVAASPEEAASIIDKAKQTGIRLDVGVTGELPHNNSFVIDGGIRTKDQDSRLFTIVDTVLTTFSITPRANLDWSLGKNSHSTKLGMDVYHANYNSDRRANPGDAPANRYNGYQTTVGGYLQDEIKVSDSVTMIAGVRLSWLGFTAGNVINPTAPGFGAVLFPVDLEPTRQTDRQYAYNFGISYQIYPRLSGFGRISRAVRHPTIDERILSSDTTTFKLNTQKSRDLEIGFLHETKSLQTSFNVFAMKLRNEIRLNPITFVNENSAPTRRVGAEFASTYNPSPHLGIAGNASFIKATYRQGIFSGNLVPLVPQWRIGSSVSWNIVPKFVNAKLSATYVDRSRRENDENNEGEQIPAYYLVDVILSGDLWKDYFGSPRWAIKITNLFDKTYYNFGARSTFNANINAYPLAGRTANLTLGWRF